MGRNEPRRDYGRSALRKGLPFCGKGVFFLLGATALLAAHSSPPASAQEKERLRAVALARRGEAGDASRLLEKLRRKYPGNEKILYDLLAVSLWAGKPGRTLELFREVKADRAPAFALSAAARAARDLGRMEEARSIYERARARFPEDRDLALGLAWTLYLDRARGNPWENLFRVLRLCRELPGKGRFRREALRLRAFTWNALGAPGAALAIALKAPAGTFSPGEILLLRRALAALEVRWGRMEPPAVEKRLEELDRAVKDLEEILRSPGGWNPATASDLIQALAARGKPRKALEIFRRLGEEGRKPRPYALPPLADCFLQVGRPGDAVRLYQDYLALRPKDVQARLGLVYALADLGRTDEAIALVEELERELPPWIWREGARKPDQNPSRVQAETAAALVRLWGGKPGEAQEILEDLVRRAPASPGFRAELAGVYTARGWYRRSREEIRAGLSLDPEFPDLLLVSARNRLESRDFPAAEEEIRRAFRLFPDRGEARRLHREWETRGLRILEVTARSGRSTGDQVGSSEYLLETRLSSSPFLHSFRGFLHHRLEGGSFPEGYYRLDRAGVGLEYRGPDLDLAGEASDDLEGESDPGLRISGTWRPDDTWSLPFSAALSSEDTPLRARKNGIEADSADLGIAWRAHESMEGRLSAGVLDFDDGNDRFHLLASFRRTLHRTALSSLDLSLEGWYSSNSKKNRPYYNPERDLSLQASLAWKRRLYRLGTRLLTQTVTLSGGEYFQKNYAPGFIGSLDYALQFDLDDRLGFLAALRGSIDRYDGNRETSFQLTLGTTWRF